MQRVRLESRSASGVVRQDRSTGTVLDERLERLDVPHAMMDPRRDTLFDLICPHSVEERIISGPVSDPWRLGGEMHAAPGDEHWADTVDHVCLQAIGWASTDSDCDVDLPGTKGRGRGLFPILELDLYVWTLHREVRQQGTQHKDSDGWQGSDPQHARWMPSVGGHHVEKLAHAAEQVVGSRRHDPSNRGQSETASRANKQIHLELALQLVEPRADRRDGAAEYLGRLPNAQCSGKAMKRVQKV